MSVLCVTLHFFTNHPRSREPRGCFTDLLLGSQCHAQNISPRPSVVKSVGFFLVSSISPCQRDCNGLWALFQQLDIPPSLSPFLRNTTNKRIMDQNSGQAISHQGKLLLASLRLGDQLGPAAPSEEPQSSGPSRRAPSQPSLPWPSAPAAKPRGLTIGAACVLFRIFEEYLLAV